MLDRVGKEAVAMLVTIALGFLLGGPTGMTICLVLAAAIGIILWTPLRDRLPIPSKKTTSKIEASGRVGYIGRPGSRGNLRNAKFGKDLDISIDNEGIVDASEADFE